MNTLRETLQSLPEDHHIFRIGVEYIAAPSKAKAVRRYVDEHLRPRLVRKDEYADILLDEISGDSAPQHTSGKQ